MDWQHISAVDILAVLRSFAPASKAAAGASPGGVTRVTVYPSDYGLERMAEEAVTGPQVGYAVGDAAGDCGG